MFDVMNKMNVLAVEMEVAGLYGLAAQYGAKALDILTVADHTGASITSEERQNTFSGDDGNRAGGR
jgi:purine-nucleoside phosphorylase